MKHLLVVFLFVSAVAAQTTAPTFFNSRTDYLVSGAFAIADFNGDGYPDIAASDATDTVVIYLNDGKGNFNKFAAIAGGPASFLVSGDFNNDGIPDIAFTGPGGVSIVLGAGDGTLRDLFTYSIDVYNTDIKAVDMNLDGNLDVVVGNTIIFGKGDGTLESEISSGCNSPFDVKDMNGDGYPDLVCGLSSGGTYKVQVYFNFGTSVQAGPSTVMPNAAPSSLALGDVDGNGTNDVVAVNSQSLVVFLNNGKGDLTQANVYELSLPSDDVKLIDVNGDGKLDALFSQTASQVTDPAENLAIWTGDGKGDFAKSATYATAGADYRIVLSDLRNDGHLDLVTGSTQTYSTLFSPKKDKWDDGPYFKIAGTRFRDAVSGDFNHDGIPDLAAGIFTSVSDGDSNQGFSGAYILLGTGKQDSPFNLGQRLFVPPNVIDLVTADFNNDGNDDLAFLTGQQLVIYLGNGDGTFTAGTTYASGGLKMAVGDFNGDGNIDIATTGVYIFQGNGDGTFMPNFAFVAEGPDILAADLNDDGKTDLIATRNKGEEFEVALGKGNGTFSPPVVYSQNSQSFVVADFSGSGFPDIALLDGSYVYVWNNNPKAPGTFTRGSETYAGSSSPLKINLVAADFNGDGIPDVATASVDLEVLTGTGTGSFNAAQIYGAADYPDFLLAGSVLPGKTNLPGVVAVGANSAISYFANTTK